MPQGNPEIHIVLERNCEYRASSGRGFPHPGTTAEESRGALATRVETEPSLKPYEWVLEIPFVARENHSETREQPGDSPLPWAEDLFHCGILREIPLSS